MSQNNTAMAKRFLSIIRKNTATIQNLTDNRDDLIRMLYTLGGDTAKERVQTTPDPDKLGAMFGNIDQLARRISDQITDLLEFKMQVTDMVNALQNEKHSRILFMRYVSLLTWDAISADTGYSTKYLFQLHKEALADFQTTHKKYMEQYFINSDKNGTYIPQDQD